MSQRDEPTSSHGGCSGNSSEPIDVPEVVNEDGLLPGAESGHDDSPLVEDSPMEDPIGDEGECWIPEEAEMPASSQPSAATPSVATAAAGDKIPRRKKRSAQEEDRKSTADSEQPSVRELMDLLRANQELTTALVKQTAGYQRRRLEVTEKLTLKNIKSARDWLERNVSHLEKQGATEKQVVQCIAAAIDPAVSERLEVKKMKDGSLAPLSAWQAAIDRVTSARHPVIDRWIGFHKECSKSKGDVAESYRGLKVSLRAFAKSVRAARGPNDDPEEFLLKAILTSTFVSTLPKTCTMPASFNDPLKEDPDVFAEQTARLNPWQETEVDAFLTTAEQKARDEGLCFHCFGAGHYSRACPKKKANGKRPYESENGPGVVSLSSQAKKMAKVEPKRRASTTSQARRETSPKPTPRRTTVTEPSPEMEAAGTPKCDVLVTVLVAKLLKCNLLVNQYSSTVLLDSCAAITLVDPTLVDRLGLIVQDDAESQVTIKTLGKDPVRISGTVQLQLRVTPKGRPMTIRAHVGSLGGRGDMLIGNNYLEPWGWEVSYRTGFAALWDRQLVPINIKTGGKQVRAGKYCLVSTQKVKLPKWSQVFLTVKVRDGPALYQENWVESSEVAARRQGLVAARGSPMFHDGKATVLVSNMSGRKRTVKPNHIVASVVVGEALPVFLMDVSALLADEQPDSLVVDESDAQAIPADLDLAAAKERLTKSQFRKLKELLRKFPKLWRRDNEQLGAGVETECTVEVLPGTRPVNEKPRRWGAVKKAKGVKEINRMTDLKVLQPSHSPYAAPVVLIEKPDGSVRFCVDYRKLNEVTVKDTYPLPRMDDLLGVLHGKKFFTALDLESGYWQIPMAEADKHKTAIITPVGLYEWNTMPFGLMNAPAVFQRAMDYMLAGAKWNHCLVYLDDVLVCSETFEEHLGHLDDVFSRMVRANFKLKPSKCRLMPKELLFLGHLISEQGIRPNPAKVAVLAAWPRPTTVKEVQSFLGLATYFRKFVDHFADVARPLSIMKGKSKKGVPDPEDVKAFIWGPEQEKSFQALKQALMSPPVLMHPIPGKPFVVETDASVTGLGAVLLQEGPDGHEHVIEYASRCLRKSELSWDSREHEALAVLWALELWEHYLDDVFTVRTDHESLRTWLKQQSRGENGRGRLTRWALRLGNFSQAIIKWRPGRLNSAADSLSRVGLDTRPETVPSDEWPERCVLLLEGGGLLDGTPEYFTRGRLRLDQQNDKLIKRWVDVLLGNPQRRLAKRKRLRLEDVAAAFTLKRGILYRQEAVVVPQSWIAHVIRSLHEPSHLSMEKLLPEIAKRFWWKNMAKDVRSYCRACLKCCRSTAYNSNRQGFLQPIVATRPWHTVNIDLLGPIGSANRGYVMVVVDHFSKWIEMEFLLSKHARSTAAMLEKCVVHRHGTPRRIITDGGTEFKGEFQALCEKLHIEHPPTAPYHPQANGQVERYNQLLGKMIRICKEDNVAVNKALAEVAFAYNTSWHKGVGNTPYFINHVRDPRLAVDNWVDRDEMPWDQRQIVEARDALHDWVNAKYSDAQELMKSRYDEHQRDPKLEIGDMVLVKEEGILPKDEMRWSKPYRIVGVEEDGLRLRVTPVGWMGRPQDVTIQRVRGFVESDLNPWRKPGVADDQLEELSLSESESEGRRSDSSSDWSLVDEDVFSQERQPRPVSTPTSSAASMYPPGARHTSSETPDRPLASAMSEPAAALRGGVDQLQGAGSTAREGTPSKTDVQTVKSLRARVITRDPRGGLRPVFTSRVTGANTTPLGPAPSPVVSVSPGHSEGSLEVVVDSSSVSPASVTPVITPGTLSEVEVRSADSPETGTIMLDWLSPERPAASPDSVVPVSPITTESESNSESNTESNSVPSPQQQAGIHKIVGEGECVSPTETRGPEMMFKVRRLDGSVAWEPREAVLAEAKGAIIRTWRGRYSEVPPGGETIEVKEKRRAGHPLD